MTFFQIERHFRLIRKLFDSCGYFVSLGYWDDYNDDFVYQFEPKYSRESFDDPTQIGRFIYHITKSSSIDKIKRLGFIPKSRNKNFNYPPRCYFFIEYDIDFMREFMIRSRKAKEGDKMIVIGVNTNALKKDTKFWKDNLFVGEDIAVYTYDNIPTSAIVGYEEID